MKKNDKIYKTSDLFVACPVYSSDSNFDETLFRDIYVDPKRIILEHKNNIFVDVETGKEYAYYDVTSSKVFKTDDWIPRDEDMIKDAISFYMPIETFIDDLFGIYVSEISLKKAKKIVNFYNKFQCEAFKLPNDENKSKEDIKNKVYCKDLFPKK